MSSIISVIMSCIWGVAFLNPDMSRLHFNLTMHTVKYSASILLLTASILSSTQHLQFKLTMHAVECASLELTID